MPSSRTGDSTTIAAGVCQASTDGICWITLSDPQDEAARDDNRSQTWKLVRQCVRWILQSFRLLGSEHDCIRWPSVL